MNIYLSNILTKKLVKGNLSYRLRGRGKSEPAFRHLGAFDNLAEAEAARDVFIATGVPPVPKVRPFRKVNVQPDKRSPADAPRWDVSGREGFKVGDQRAKIVFVGRFDSLEKARMWAARFEATGEVCQVKEPRGVKVRKTRSFVSAPNVSRVDALARTQARIEMMRASLRRLGE